MRSRFRPKHQRLILQCYPGGRAGEKHPNSSELSYLLFYVSSRRTKLLKVARYLNQKIRQDLWRGRAGNVQVSLDIATALIEKCPEDLNVFADHIVSIITAVLNSNDLALCHYTETIFDVFCMHHNGALFTDDSDFIQNFDNLIKLYMDIRSRGSERDDWTAVSLQAACCIASSGALYASSSQLRFQISTILPVILDQLKKYSEDRFIQLNNYLTSIERTQNTSESTRVNRASISSITQDNPHDENDILALRALKKLFDCSDTHVSQIRFTSRFVIKYVIDHPSDQNWVYSAVDLLAQWIPVHLRFVLLRSLYEFLMELPLSDTNSLLGVTQLMSSLLSSNVSLIGLSVLDVLHVLLSLITQLLRLNDVSPDPKREKLLNNLAHAIGDLATHLYYSDQIANMAEEILMRIRPLPFERRTVSSNGQPKGRSEPIALSLPTSTMGSTMASAINLEKFIDKGSLSFFSEKPAIVIGLQIIVQIIHGANSGTGGINRKIIPIQSWDQTEWALTSSDVQIRDAYVDALYAYFNMEISSLSESGTIESPDVLGSISTGIVFLNKLHSSIYDYALKNTNTSEDYMNINMILLSIVSRLGLIGIVHGLPMVLQLQDTVSRTQDKYSRNSLASLQAVILIYYSTVADKLGIPKLKKQVDERIKFVKAKKGGWDSNLTAPAKLRADRQLSKSTLSNGDARNEKQSVAVEDEDDEQEVDDEWKPLPSMGNIDRGLIIQYIKESNAKLSIDTVDTMTSVWSKESAVQNTEAAQHLSIMDDTSPLFTIPSTTKIRSKPLRVAW
ncbi:uncharacterized protein V1516DRAFT_324373 [Lipomyces oligophaga]|uniref:uncharacterized protein n=1 Tax=Lipomyces oligophaga TaxID=45792 RepID=UPI0034CEEE3D